MKLDNQGPNPSVY